MTMTSDEPKESAGAARGPVKSASRTIDVLELLADSAVPPSLSEIAHALGAPKSSLHGVLQTLVERGWVQMNDRGPTYSVGLRALRVGGALLDFDPLVQTAGAVLADLSAELDETVHFARLDGSDVVYLATHESTHYIRVTSRIGRRLPAHATSLGKALLARRSWEEVDALLPAELLQVTPFTTDSRAALRIELEQTRVRGWALEESQTTVGLTCFGVALPGESDPVNALSCAVPDSRVSDEHTAAIIQGLAKAASELAMLARRAQ